jgi:hypothetical protein
MIVSREKKKRGGRKRKKGKKPRWRKSEMKVVM